MKKQSTETKAEIKITEVFAGKKTLEELFLKFLLNHQNLSLTDNKKLNV